MTVSRMFKFASLVACVIAEDFEPGTVHVLTEANFDDYIKEKEAGALVEFYAPWCGHCKKLEPEFDKAAEMLKEEGIAITLAKVDATVESALGTRFEVNGYPTLKYFVGGKPTEFDGGRDAAKIVEWIKQMSGPAVQESEPKDTDNFSVTLYGPELTDTFQNVAKLNRKAAQWYYVKSDDNNVVLQHKKEPTVKQSAADLDEDALGKFFTENKFPMFGALDGDTFSIYIERGNGLVWGLFPMTTDNVESVVEEHRAAFTEVAQKFGSEFSVTWTNTNEFGKVLESMFGITEFPRVVVQTKAGDKKNFIYDGAMDAASIIKYMEDVKSGAVQAHLKSEAAPEEPQEDPVKVIVGSTMEEKVFTADKDVLLEVYAPWCGHCKKLEPEYNKVGKKVIKEGLEDLVVIAKMDGTANDSPVDSVSWSGFPTIYYVKAGDKTPVKFDGGRDAKAIWKWIKQNHSKKDEIKARLLSNKEGKDKKPATKEEL